jgi:hypothetical protein
VDLRGLQEPFRCACDDENAWYTRHGSQEGHTLPSDLVRVLKLIMQVNATYMIIYVLPRARTKHEHLKHYVFLIKHAHNTEINMIMHTCVLG